MNYLRFMIVDETDPMNVRQTEVDRSAPNALQPTIEYGIPVEYEASRVKVVVGYGNTDVYIYCVRPDELPAASEPAAADPGVTVTEPAAPVAGQQTQAAAKASTELR